VGTDCGGVVQQQRLPGETAHSGSWFAWLDGYGFRIPTPRRRQVSIPAGKTTATLPSTCTSIRRKSARSPTTR